MWSWDATRLLVADDSQFVVLPREDIGVDELFAEASQGLDLPSLHVLYEHREYAASVYDYEHTIGRGVGSSLSEAVSAACREVLRP